MSDDPEETFPVPAEGIEVPLVLSGESDVIDVDIRAEKAATPISPEVGVVSSNSSSYKTLLNSANFPSNYYYPSDHQDLQRLSRPQELNSDFLQLHRSFGFDTAKRNSLHVIDENYLLFVMGNTVQSMDMTNGNQNVLFGYNTSLSASVSCICVHPSQRYFAVAECGDRPNIYIYSWPEMRIIRILRGGAEISYGSVCFSPCGTRLGSVSGDPDYSLVVWEWAEERVLLRLKAFSQEVSLLSFSVQQPGVMYTAGQAHVKFWSLAETFTGLKLQGFLGKFGRINICDICCVLEDNGVVLTGTEHGQLLLWDRSTHIVRAELYRSYGKGQLVDGFIVNEHGQVFVPPGTKPPSNAVSVVYSNARLDNGVILGDCHAGEIIALSVQDSILTTFGKDGILRKWEWQDVSMYEGVVALQCINEVDVQIEGRSAVLNNNNWIIAGVCGQVVMLEPNGHRRVLLSTHSGAVVSTKSNRGDIVVSGGGGCGTVRVWDVIQGQQIYARKISDSGVSFIKQVEFGSEERFIVGHADGTVRILALVSNGISIVGICKPQTCAITNITLSTDTKYMITAAADGTLFITEVTNHGVQLKPLYLIQLPLLQQFATARATEKLLTKEESIGSKVKGDGISSGVTGAVSLCYSWDEKSIFLGYGQYLLELYLPGDVVGDLPNVPSPGDRDTYLTVCPMRLHDISLNIAVQRPRTAEEIEVLVLEGVNLSENELVEEFLVDPRVDPVSVVLRNIYYNEIGHVLYNHGVANMLVAFTSGNNNLTTLLPPNSIVLESKKMEKYRTLYQLGNMGSNSSASAGMSTSNNLVLGTWVYGITTVHLQETQGLMVFGSANGTIEVRDSADHQYYLCGHFDNSQVLCITSNLQWISVTTALGGVWMLKHSLNSALQEADRTYSINLYTNKNQIVQSEKERAKHLQGIETRNERLQTQAGVYIPLTSSYLENAWMCPNESILDIGAVSLHLSAEEAKQRHEHDELASIASKKKLLLLNEMKHLVEDYNVLRDKAASVGVHINGLDIDAESHHALRTQSEELSTRLEAVLRSDVQREVASCERFIESVSRNMEQESMSICSLVSDLYVKAPHVMKLVVKPCLACANGNTNTATVSLGIDPEPPVLIGSSNQTVAEEEKSFQADIGAVLTSATGATTEKRHALLTQRKELIQRTQAAMNEEQLELPKMDTSVCVYKQKVEEEENNSIVPNNTSIGSNLDLVIGSTCTCMEQELRDKIHELERSIWERVHALRQVKYTLLLDLCHHIFRIMEINQSVGLISAENMTSPTIDFSYQNDTRHQMSEAERIKTFDWVKGKKTGVDGLLHALGHCLDKKEAFYLQNQLIHLSEWPESRYIVTDDEITAFSTRIREDIIKSKLNNNTHSGGFDGDDFGMEDTAGTTTATTVNPTESTNALLENTTDELNGGNVANLMNINHENITETAMTVELIMNLWEQRDLHNERLSLLPTNQLDEHEYMLEMLTLCEEREGLFEMVRHSVLSFDVALEQLRLEKMKITRDITAHRCSLLHCAEERSVEAAYTELEDNLRVRMSKCVKNISNITQEINACQGNIESLHTIIRQGEADREGTLREFNTLIQHYIDTYRQPEDPEGSGSVLNVTEIYPMLLRYFLLNDVNGNSSGNGKLNINATNTSEEYNNEESEDEDDEESTSMNTLSAVCDATLLEAVQVLRNSRLQVESDIVSKEENVAELNKLLQRLTARSKLIEKDAITIADEAREVSRDKRHALFRVTTTVPLRQSQIYPSANSNLRDSTIIGTDTINILQNRVFILEQYARTLQDRIAGYRKEGRGYVREVEIKKKKLLEEEAHCKDVQLLKFGQLIELDVLGKVGVDDESQALRHKLRWMEDISDRKAREWQEKVRVAKDELLKATEENTALLEKVSKLTSLQSEIERELNNQTKNLHLKQGGDVGVADGDNEGKKYEQELIHKIQSQEKEIDALRSELAALKMKRGRMYAPITQEQQ